MVWVEMRELFHPSLGMMMTMTTTTTTTMMMMMMMMINVVLLVGGNFHLNRRQYRKYWAGNQW